MNKEITVLFLSGSGKTVKRAHFTHRTLCGLLITAIFACIILAVGLVDYIQTGRKRIYANELEAERALKNQELKHYQKQIQKFAGIVNDLKTQVVEINQMDRQIRQVAGMEEPSGLFGIGGSVPDDLNPEIGRNLITNMHQQVDELKNAYVYQKNSLSNLQKVVEERKNLMAFTPTIIPADGWISSRFGYRISPFDGKREFHKGLDIANCWNSPIMATANGRIAFVGENSSFGKVVIIEHGLGFTTLYAHLEQISIKHGDTIERGDIIGSMGSTGRSTGVHIHYEVRLNGHSVNPEKYILK